MRVLQPPGGADHDIFGLKMDPEVHKVKVYPTHEQSPPPCFPPKDRKLITHKQRSKDRQSDAIASVLGVKVPNQDPNPMNAEMPFRQLGEHAYYNLHNSSSVSNGMSMGELNVPTTSTPRPVPVTNNSSNVRKVLGIEPDDANFPKTYIGRPAVDNDSRHVHTTFETELAEDIVWHPQNRRAFDMLHVKGLHDKRGENDSAAEFARRQQRLLAHKNSHYAPSKVFTAESPRQQKPYIYRNILALGGAEPETPLPGPWKSLCKNVHDPLTGDSIFVVRKPE